MEPEVDPSAIEISEIEFDHEELRVFWDLARFHAKLNAAPTYFGPTTLESVPPPAWAYGESVEESDAFVAQVLADRERGLDPDERPRPGSWEKAREFAAYVAAVA